VRLRTQSHQMRSTSAVSALTYSCAKISCPPFTACAGMRSRRSVCVPRLCVMRMAYASRFRLLAVVALDLLLEPVLLLAAFFLPLFGIYRWERSAAFKKENISD
jgi:hypothetical protein